MQERRAELAPYGYCEVSARLRTPLLRISLTGLKPNEDHCLVTDAGVYLAVFSADSAGGVHDTIKMQKATGKMSEIHSVQLEECGSVIAAGAFE